MNLESKPIKPTDLLKKELEADLSNGFEKTNKSLPVDSNCFYIKPMNEWIEGAKNRPIPNMLFSELWYENEICILFADTNLGKSILALQISNALSKGINIEGFKMEVQSQKVMYFDFELSDKQAENRYSENYLNHYEFSSNLLRVEINPENEIPIQFKDFDSYLCHSIECSIVKYDTKIVVIDNLTYLKSDTEKAKDALPLMKLLNGLKKKYNLSILVLAHTPKRDSSKALTKNDLSGSKMLMNFCDSSFAIGESSQQSGIRYLKQIKQRNTELIFDIHNVIICQIEKKSNFLEFVFLGFESEINHLKPKNNEDQLEQIMELQKLNLPKTQIAIKLGVSEGTVRNRIKKMENL